MSGSEQARVEAFIKRVREIAREHGYAIGVHGSLKRDLDLIAVPWTEDAGSVGDLLDALADFGLVQGEAQTIGDRWVGPSVQKPHGRTGFVLHGAPEFLYVDLSVMPRLTGLVECVDKQKCPGVAVTTRGRSKEVESDDE
jgi:hypothetical protein